MLSIFGQTDSRRGFCDRLSRRNFLTVGGTIAGGMMLPQLLAQEAAAGTTRSHKGVIVIYLPGGPPHLDMWDMKPDAPAEIRGEFNPIKTNVPGIEICEHFPKIASIMDKFAIIRSLVGNSGDHSAYQAMTGQKTMINAPPGGWPAFGSWVSKVQGAVNGSVPPHLSLMYQVGNATWGYPGEGGFLGMGHAPFRLVGRKADGTRSESMTLQGMTLDRLQDRKSLLGSFDRFRREADATGSMGGLDEFSKQALGILTTSKLADALDLSKEDPKIVERYGKDDAAFQRDGSPKMVRNFCIARRLIEAGARVVSLNFSRWDWHGGDGMNFPEGRDNFPRLDQGLYALISDLHERGLSRDVSVLVYGEFGRTPKINSSASRDHWPQVNMAMLAGGGMRTGQVIGATNRLGEYAVDRPVTHQEIFATLYHQLGFNLSAIREFDLRGRPQYPVENGTEPIRELI